MVHAGWIKAGRTGLGLTQAELADVVGVSQATVSQWERGSATPNPLQLEKLREVLGDSEAQGDLPLAAPAAEPAPEEAAAAEEPPAEEAPKTRKKRAPKAPSKEEARKASLGFEDKLWEAADLMRNNMDPAEYKHVVLGLLFLKYISDAFTERQNTLRRLVCEDTTSDYYVADPAKREKALAEVLEDKDEYTAENIFWVPPLARWAEIQKNARKKQIDMPNNAKPVDIGGFVDLAMEAIERANLRVRGVLPKIYGMPNLDKESLGKLIELIGDIGLGSAEHRAKDTLGAVYQYFLSKFASAEGKGGGEFYTPTSVVRVLVDMLEPYSGRVYDPCCGSGGMFVQSLKFIAEHGGKRDNVSIFGQESNHTTWRLAKMNLAIRGLEANLGEKHADTFREDQHPDLRADYILANPPFNVSEWHGEKLQEDVRWKGFSKLPPAGNANFAWLLHIVHHLAPTGTAGVVLANGSMSSMSSGEGEIRKELVEKDLVDCMVALPGQLFYATQIPVCLWFLARDKRNGRFRDRRGEVLFIDARKLGRLETRVHRVLDDGDVGRIAGTYHAWRNRDGGYVDVAGFCKAATKEEVEKHGFVLTPGRYVRAEEVEEDGEGFELKMRRLVGELKKQQEEGRRLDEVIGQVLGGLGYVR